MPCENVNPELQDPLTLPEKPKNPGFCVNVFQLLETVNENQPNAKTSGRPNSKCAQARSSPRAASLQPLVLCNPVILQTGIWGTERAGLTQQVSGILGPPFHYLLPPAKLVSPFSVHFNAHSTSCIPGGKGERPAGARPLFLLNLGLT